MFRVLYNLQYNSLYTVCIVHPYNYLQLYREVKGILLYQGFPRPILREPMVNYF